MVAKTKDKQKKLIKGIDAIRQALYGTQIDVLMDLKNRFNLPIYKINGKNCPYWEADEDELKRWLSKRKIKNLSKINSDFLEEFEIRKASKNGKLPKTGKQLKGINEITKFYGRSLTNTYNLFKNYDGCPIEKNNGEFSVDADKFLSWLLDRNLIKWHEVRLKIEQWKVVDNFVV